MTPEDREQLQALRRQQLELQRSLARLDLQLADLEVRAGAAPEEIPAPPTPPALPPLPPHAEPPPVPPTPPIPSFLLETPPLPANLPPLPPLPEPPPPRSLEFQFGRWLIAVSAVFGVILLALIFNWTHARIYQILGPGGVIGLSTLASVGVLLVGENLGRRTDARRYIGGVVTAMALAWLYLTAYAIGYYEPLRIIGSPILAGFLLLLWPVYVVLLAERRSSQTLALFAVTLAYFSTAINPIGRFTMAADLLLAGTAVLFLVRNGWAGLTYLSLAGTYLALLRRLILDENGELVLDTSRTLHFWPYAVYLIGAWLIFTAAVVFTAAPAFRGGKRLAFLSLNNGALAGLLLLTAYISGYGHSPMGWILLTTGLVLLLTSRVVGWTQVEPEKLAAAYVAQGLTLVTAGLIVVYTGLTRGFLLMVETLFLGMAGSFTRDRILISITYLAGFFATLFLIWEIAVNAHHPWLLGFGGATVMLLNAWWARGDLRHSFRARTTVVLSSSYYCALATGLIFTALSSELSANALPPALALTALALTFLIYLVSLYELPPIAQTLLLAAQALVLYPADTGEIVPWWTTAVVAAVTLVMITWWTRQRVTRTGNWVEILNLVYAFALAGLAYQTLRPWVDAQGWMVTASLLSVAFLVWGAFTRTWPIALVGQLFLAIAVTHFFLPPLHDFPWTWWASAMPIAVVFSTARAAREWLRLFPEIDESQRASLGALARGYQLLALAMLIRWVCALVPSLDQVSVFLLLGTLVLYANIRPFSLFGIRCSFVLSLLGLWLYIGNLSAHALEMASFLNALAFLAFVAQPAVLRLADKTLDPLESWALILFSIAAGWLFASVWIQTRLSPGYLTMGWALVALFVYLFGAAVGEKRQRWCGLAILLAAIVRVFCYDFWGLTNGYRILTFVILTLITFGLGYLILRIDRTKGAGTPLPPPPPPQ